MQSVPDQNKDSPEMNDIRIQQFLEAARAYLFGMAAPQATLAPIPAPLRCTL